MSMSDCTCVSIELSEAEQNLQLTITRAQEVVATGADTVTQLPGPSVKEVQRHVHVQ